MPITIEEIKGGRRRLFGESERAYLVRGATDDESAYAALQASPQVPANFGNRTRRRIAADEVANATLTDQYRAVVRWTNPENTEEDPPPEEGNPPVLSFSTRGGRTRITQSLATISRTHDPSLIPSAPDFAGAIQVSETRVEGTDIFTPVFEFSEEHTLSSAAFVALRPTLYQLTAKVNSGSFRGFDPGEVLFIGATGRQPRGETGTVNLAFLAAENLTNVPVGDIVVATKLAWDFLWVLYGESETSDQTFITRRPAAAYVERVYRQASFAGLPA